MTISIRVVPTGGQFAATVVGEPQIRVVQPTREAAVDALKQELQEMVSRGELETVEVFPQGFLSLFGKYRDDPTLDDIIREAYAARDAERL